MAGFVTPPLLSPQSSNHESLTSQTTILDPGSRWTRNYDEGEDVTAPKTKRAKHMNQSFISMIASAGLSSSISPDFGSQDAGTRAENESSKRRRSIRHEQPSPQHMRSKKLVDRGVSAVERRRKSERPILQSSPGLSRPSRPEKHSRVPSDTMLQSQILVPPTRPPKPPSRPSLANSEPEHPVLEKTPVDAARSAAVEPPTQPQSNREKAVSGDRTRESDTPLAEQLASMFGLEEPEGILAEYPCNLLQSIEQQGYMYLLQNHVCFYAYLPKRRNRTSKSGYLWKRGKRNPNFNRYWFILKGDVLSYYTPKSSYYFPRNTIDLRSGVSTSLQDPAPDGTTPFSITTPQETFTFKADDVDSAGEWVEQIKRIVFRSHHTGDSIKIRIPLTSIANVEDVQMGSLANMMSIKLIDDTESSDDARSVNEYIFSFAGSDSESFQKLYTAARNTPKTTDASSQTRVSDDLEEIALDDPPSANISLDSASDEMHPPGPAQTNDGEDMVKSSSKPSQTTSLSSSQQTIVRPSSAISRTDSYSSISGLYRAGADRLRQASGLAGAIGQGSKRMKSLLANESKEYYDKVTGMWTGNKMHYDANEKPFYRRVSDDEDDDANGKNHGESFRKHFSLPESEKLGATFFAYLYRNVPIYGKIYVGSTKLCFRSLSYPQTKMILPFKDIESVGKEKGYTNFGYSGIVILIKGHEEMFFEFSKNVARDDFALTMIHMLDTLDPTLDSKLLDGEGKTGTDVAKAEHESLEKARSNSKQLSASHDKLAVLNDKDHKPIMFDDIEASILDFQPNASLDITCLTIGSRGDVQPYIALCKGLMAEGHRPSIATHAEFEAWIRSHGIDFKQVAGDPGKIMQLCVENDMFTIKFMQEAQSFRGFLDDLFVTSWKACQGTDLLIESPSAMAGVHIAEALQIPYFRAFTMPWSPTRAYPHAFAVTKSKLGGKWNHFSYRAFDFAFWQATAGQLNRFRTKVLDLPKTGFHALRTYEIPFLYNFSPSVVSPPLDFGPQIHITGYWFLDEGKEYKPPADLLAFIETARKEQKKLVYVGFGSVTVDDPAALTRAVTEAVQDADVRCILCKGWSDRLDKKDASVPEIPLPDSIFPIKAAPHDWLFKQVDAAVHHGGAGTTGASLRAGIPTVIKPFFGDQHFFASRVDDLGVGIALRVINNKTLALALREATQEQRLTRRAKDVGERIRSEDGVKTAIKMIHRDLEYARSLIKRRDTQEQTDSVAESEESWDLLSNESGTEDAETSRKTTSHFLDFPGSLGAQGRSGHDLGGETSTSARSSVSHDDIYDSNDDDDDD